MQGCACGGTGSCGDSVRAGTHFSVAGMKAWICLCVRTANGIERGCVLPRNKRQNGSTRTGQLCDVQCAQRHVFSGNLCTNDGLDQSGALGPRPWSHPLDKVDTCSSLSASASHARNDRNRLLNSPLLALKSGS